LGIWRTTPQLPREGYDRLQDNLVSDGFVSPGTPFETALDASFAQKVMDTGGRAVVIGAMIAILA
jgi:hypothetical protein